MPVSKENFSLKLVGTYQRSCNCLQATPAEEAFPPAPIPLQSIEEKIQVRT